MSYRYPVRIVLAEDDAQLRALLVHQLSDAGYDVIACENGRQALAAVSTEFSCIVLADWMMPAMDGVELCRTVRELGEAQSSCFIYFILLTSQSDKDSIVAGLDAGADDYLTKPYHPRELLARLRAGERLCVLQRELLRRQVEFHRANAELAALNSKLEKLANTDALTGLANRRYLFERLAEAWSLAERNERALSCIMFDLDSFKSVNDTYGHAAGDRVLQIIAQATRDCLRRYDIVARVGGEEFCILCPELQLDGAVGLAERLRQTIAETKCDLDGATLAVTASFGVATRSPGSSNADALIVLADRMLYRAKEDGRDQVWVCDANGRARRSAATTNVS
jgi:two-component system cell cycle response regulator